MPYRYLSGAALRALLYCALLTAGSAALQAQDPFDAVPIPDGPVNALAVIEDTLYFGGDFQFVGPNTGAAAAIDLATEQVLDDFPRLRASRDRYGVEAAVPDGNGGFFLAGDIVRADSIDLRNLVHVLPDGSVDLGFLPNPTEVIPNNDYYYGEVTRMSLSDGVLFIGGEFNTVAGEARENFAALDAETGALLPFYPATTDAEGEPRPPSQAILRDGVVVIRGGFAAVDGQPRAGLAALDFETGAVLPWDPNPDGYVWRLLADDDGLVAAGSFGQIGGVARDRLAALDFPTAENAQVTMQSWAPVYGFASNPFSYNIEYDYALSDNALWIAGSFVEAPGNDPRIVAPLVRFSRDVDTPYAEAALFEEGYSNGRAVATDGETAWVSAATTGPGGGIEAGWVVGVDAETMEPSGYVLLTGEDRPLQAPLAGPQIIAMAYQDGRLVIGGSRLELGGAFDAFYGAVDLTTGKLLGRTREPFEASVTAVQPYPDGRRVYLERGSGSCCTEVDLVTGERFDFAVPYYDSIALRDSADAPPVGPDVYTARQSGALRVTRDRLYVVARGGASGRHRLRAVDPQTLRPDPDFAVELGVNPNLTDIAFADGWIYLAGEFEGASTPEYSFRFYARVDSLTGAIDTSWVPDPRFVSDEGGGPIAVTEDRITFGAWGMVQFLEEPAQGFAAISRPGGERLPWNASVSGGTLEHVLDLQYADSVFYAAGTFTDAGGEPSPYLAAFDMEGALLDWPEEEPSVEVRVLVSPRHRQAYLGGEGDVGGGQQNLGTSRLLGSGTSVAAEPDAAESAQAALAVFPNPSSGTATVALALPSAAEVRVEVFDLLGRRVALLHDGPLAAGAHALPMEGQRLASGLYLVRAVADDLALTKRVTVVR